MIRFRDIEFSLGELSVDKARMLNALRYYWIISKGHRLTPWRSPYVQWRMETFFGHEAADLSAGQFFRLMWRERARMERFLVWVAEQRAGLRSPK